ncbi:hypothetical protein ACVNS2_32460 [Paenibacillus caseinilyticus]|uniref:Lipoprotein n=1 Tax=Paenibacillus mucilaginosus K02 TaxID=997761 RepID=I0BST7_9BACL|nr:hypothetical protein [Paenibacillus mucilaginosus]AFH65434.1 hypothetical protein B2K_32815 [Paenibacillus mucilaginosus K02]
MLQGKRISELLISLTVCSLLLAGCGKAQQEQQGAAKAQSAPQETKPPIDSELQQHMKMYQDLKKQETEQLEKRRKEEKKTLEKLQKEKEKTLLREFDTEEKIRKGGNPWKSLGKKEEGKEKGGKEEKKEGGGKGDEQEKEGGDAGQSGENQGGGSGS